MVKWLRLTRGLEGPEALETARRLGLVPEHGDVKNSSRVERKRSVRPERTAALPPSVFRRQRASGRSPSPLRGLLPLPHPGRDRVRPCLPLPREPSRPQGRSLHPAFRREVCGDLDPPCSAAALALPGGNPDRCDPGRDRRRREVRRCLGRTGGGIWSTELAGRQRRRPAHGTGTRWQGGK